jgi:flagellin-specific chaperone FliS
MQTWYVKAALVQELVMMLHHGAQRVAKLARLATATTNSQKRPAMSALIMNVAGIGQPIRALGPTRSAILSKTVMMWLKKVVHQMACVLAVMRNGRIANCAKVLDVMMRSTLDTK